MSKTLAFGYTDTAGVTAKTTQMPGLNFSADYSVVSESANELVLANTVAGYDQPTTIRVATREIPDVYKGSNIPSALSGPSKGGMEILIESRFTPKVTESTTGVEYLLPAKVGITMRVPRDGNLTADNVLTMLNRAIATAFEQGDNTSARIGKLIRGVKRPVVLQ